MSRDYQLRSYEFRREREAAWHELEQLVARVERSGVKSLSADELNRLPTLYRSALSSLSVARAISLDKNVTTYLEGLCARAYFTVYCRKRFLGHTVFKFFSESFPRMIRGMRWALFLSIALVALGVACGYVMTDADPDRYYSFISEEMAQGRDPSASAAELAEVLYDGDDSTAAALTQFAATLFTNNAKIGLLCFAIGFLAGVPVMLILFINGLSLGAMMALYANAGLGFEFFAWVMPHGITEFLAICVCGAAGLSVGYGVVFPGKYKRLENLAIRGRTAAAVTIGAVLMFFVAALIEGFFRQLVPDTNVRVAVIVLTGLFWVGYLGYAGREPRAVAALRERGHVDELRTVAEQIRASRAREPAS